MRFQTVHSSQVYGPRSAKRRLPGPVSYSVPWRGGQASYVFDAESGIVRAQIGCHESVARADASNREAVAFTLLARLQAQHDQQPRPGIWS
jgi:hypothetical protein